MLKICGYSISNLFRTWNFSFKLPKNPVLLLFIRNYKQSIKNNRPVSFLPIWRKIQKVTVQHVLFFHWKRLDISKINLGLNQVNPAPTSFYQLPMMVFWWSVASKRWFFWHIKNVWQSLASGSDIKN